MDVTTEMRIDVPLLRKTLEHIEAHPEEHDQTCWAKRTLCGTAACLAGWAVQLAGQELDWIPVLDQFQYDVADFLADGFTTISQAAAELLGLTEYQAGILFNQYNTRDALWQLAHLYTDGEIEVPEKYL